MTFIIQGGNMLAVICSTNKPWENLIRIDNYLTLQQTARYRLGKVISSRGFRMIESAMVLEIKAGFKPLFLKLQGFDGKVA